MGTPCASRFSLNAQSLVGVVRVQGELVPSRAELGKFPGRAAGRTSDTVGLKRKLSKVQMRVVASCTLGPAVRVATLPGGLRRANSTAVDAAPNSLVWAQIAPPS